MKTQISDDFLKNHIIVVDNNEELETLLNNSNINRDFLLRSKTEFPFFIVTMITEDLINSFSYSYDRNNKENIQTISNAFNADIIEFSAL